LRDVFSEEVSKILNRYLVQFKGLAVGQHVFSFDVDKAFFDEFEGGEISNGRLSVEVILNRLSNMIELDFFIEGDVEVKCDRCLEVLTIPTEFEGKLVVRISDSIDESEVSDEIWYVSSNEHELSLAQYIYESICLSLPLQRYHGILGTSTDDCDSEMLERLQTLSLDENQEVREADSTDSRWDKLKDLMNNQN
jgi:uncharacterized metal-binding protein YceD (DUF177 family)